MTDVIKILILNIKIAISIRYISLEIVKFFMTRNIYFDETYHNNKKHLMC